ncbi:hypothetical protein B0H14DRAFT_3428869 [Mycena olivaceomarginata]|nr:hypothetical protein B0H14DRAFT_3428869 [Mycena olivaceomarginata]
MPRGIPTATADRRDEVDEQVGLAIDKGDVKTKSGADKAVVRAIRGYGETGLSLGWGRNKAPVRYGPCPRGIPTATADRRNKGDERAGPAVGKGDVKAKSRADKAVVRVGSNVNKVSYRRCPTSTKAIHGYGSMLTKVPPLRDTCSARDQHLTDPSVTRAVREISAWRAPP